MQYDDGGKIASTGKVNLNLLQQLNELNYYSQPAPKSLSNDFGTTVVYPIIENAHLAVEDALRTYTEHIAIQIKAAVINDEPNNSG